MLFLLMSHFYTRHIISVNNQENIEKILRIDDFLTHEKIINTNIPKTA